MVSYRVVARLDIKGANLIKGVCMEGLRVLGKPAEFAKRYADEGADELLYIDTVASLYGRNQLESLLESTAEDVFVPITVAGGIRSKGSAAAVLRAGADKVALNTAAIRDPNLVRDLADHFGRQAVTVSIEAKKNEKGWECYTDCGREKTGKDAIRWAHEASEWAGEILLTSIDRDGTKTGPDLDLISQIDIDVPLVVSGGVGKVEHLEGLKGEGVAIGTAFHYGSLTVQQVKEALRGSRVIR